MPNLQSPSDEISSFQGLALAKARELRNVVNVEELDAWLANLGERFSRDPLAAASSLGPSRNEKSLGWLSTVARNWMLRRGATSNYTPSPAILLASPAWIKKATEANLPLHRLDLADAEMARLESILDWMASPGGPSPTSDWSRISVEQAEASEHAWIDAMAKAAAQRDLDASEAAGTSFFCSAEASAGKGWRWVQVVASDSLDREGALMRHCVGSYADTVEEGRSVIYSLRDPDNKPRLTIEARGPHLSQLKAFANGACPPNLMPAAREFAFAALFWAHRRRQHPLGIRARKRAP